MQLERQFQTIGARVKVRIASANPEAIRRPAVLDIQRDKQGEYFEIERGPGVRLHVPDARPIDRHLLLTVCDARLPVARRTSQFLCGHDERAWFVAAVPEQARAATVQDAMDALKPKEVWRSIEQHQLSVAQRNTRRNAAFVRQGEWFFVPQPDKVVTKRNILLREPISRGRGESHWCEELYRDGGERVWVSRQHPNGLSRAQWRQLSNRERDSHFWTIRHRNAVVWVRGHVSHRDHATIYLDCWHRVVMNTETRARAMEHVVFLD